MNPLTSYIIWFTQRSGSTLLSRGLASTGLAGNPGEAFTLFEGESLQGKYKVDTFGQLKHTVWEQGSTENGVFGMKMSMSTHESQMLNEEILAMGNSGRAKKVGLSELWEEIAPNCKHIFLTRRNKIRQAVSWWKAINDNVWHVEKGKTYETEEAFYQQHYDFNALNHLLQELLLKECLLQSYFNQHGIVPFTIVYEDYIQDFAGSIQAILGFLGIKEPPKHPIEMPYQPTATPHSEIWVQQFRADLQKNWEKQVW